MTESVLGLPRKTAFILAGIVVAFVLCATAYTLTYGHSFRKPTGDGVGYERMAKQLLTKGVYGYKSTSPNAYVTPGYPLFLAALYAAGGNSTDGRPRALLVGLQILLACGTLVAVFLIGRLVADDYAGLIAAALVALYPPMIVATNLWFTETLATFTLAWFIYAALVATRQEGWKLWALAGALLGLAVLVRPAALPIGAAPFLALLITGPRTGLVRAVLAFGVAWALVMAPWVTRNVMTLHEPALLSSHSGDPMLAGVDPYYYDLGPQYEFHGPTYDRYYEQPSGATKDELARAAIREGFRTRPLQFAWWFTVGKAARVYSDGWLGSHIFKAYGGTWSTMIRALTVVMGWIGVVFSLRDRRLLLIAIAILLGTAVLLPFVPEPRFVFSYLPLLAVLAAAMLRRLWAADSSPTAAGV